MTFSSAAPDLVPGDTNGLEDVFLHDARTGATQRVSVSGTGAQANRGGGRWAGLGSRFAAVSPNGRLVAFSSTASNLVPGDTNRAEDVFVHNRLTRRTRRVSVTSGGAQATGADGSFSPRIAGPRLVLFSSNATNLVPGDVNRHYDEFVHDLRRHATARAVIGAGGQAGTVTTRLAFSANGRWVTFTSPDPQHVPGDTNGFADAFVFGPLRRPWRLPGLRAARAR